MLDISVLISIPSPWEPLISSNPRHIHEYIATVFIVYCE